MALYVLHCIDKEGTLEQRFATRPAHIARLEQLDAEGRLLTAGAMPKQRDNPQAGFYGSVMIVDFDSREALDAWLADEPFLKAGVYECIDVRPFNKAFPKD
ncbi:MAG: YciI family protein [Acinetobacter sp.]|nr:YciI family protein [Acinetobacter sp.]